MATTASGIYYPDPSDTFLPAQDMQALAASVETYVAVPLGKFGRSSNFSVPNNAVTAIAWDVEWMKTSGITHSTVTNADRVIPTRAGYYECDVRLVFNNNATGERRGYVGKNGSQYGPVDRLTSVPNLQVSLGTGTIITVNGSTDYLQAFAFQDSGGALGVVGDGVEAQSFNCVFTVKFLRPL